VTVCRVILDRRAELEEAVLSFPARSPSVEIVD